MNRALQLSEVASWLAQEADSSDGQVAVLAGHFAIYSAGAAAVDLLDDPLAPAHAGAEMVAFTRFTWQAACEAAAALGSRAPRLVVLADDIQFIRPQLADRGKEEQLAAGLAAHYLANVPGIPAHHLRVMAAHGVSTDRILRQGESQWTFSERALRIAAVRHMREELACGRAADLETSDDGQTVTVTLPEHGDYCLVHSGRTTCAGGYIELLTTLHARGIRKLIALVPMRCLGPIGLGTVLARRLFPLPGLEVVNVAIPDPSLALPASVFGDEG